MIRYFHSVAYAIIPALVPEPKPVQPATLRDLAEANLQAAITAHFQATKEADTAIAKLAEAETLVAARHEHLTDLTSGEWQNSVPYTDPELGL